MALPTELRVLIVDDDPDICEALRDLLEAYQYTVQSVGNGAAALARIEGQQFAAVVLDLELPDISGLEVLARLTAHAPNLPIIILTANPSDGNKTAALCGGAVALLAKPYHRDVLLSVLSSAIRLRSVS